MFKKAVRISVDISPADRSEFESSSVHTISIVLESGKCVVAVAKFGRVWVHLFNSTTVSRWCLCRLCYATVRNMLGFFISHKLMLEVVVILNVRNCLELFSNVITRLRMLRLVNDLNVSRQFFNQWEAKPRPFASCTRDFSRVLSKLQVISRNSDWFISLFALVVIGRSNYSGIGFSTVIWKPPYEGNRYKWTGLQFILILEMKDHVLASFSRIIHD